MYLKPIILLCLCVTQLCFSQTSDWHFSNDITVISEDNLLPNAWSGGIDATSFHKVDYDFDGDDDLIVFDDADSSLNLFEWTEDEQYVHILENPHKNISIKNFVYFSDFNKDGIQDLITSNNFRLSCYLGNNEDGFLKFAEESYFLNSTIGTIFADETPSFFDAGADGDIDFINFDETGQFIHFFENISDEYSTNTDSLFFNLTDECWGNFRYFYGNDSLAFGDCNGKKPIDNNGFSEKAMHIVPSIFTKDLNEDGNSDLLISDARYDGFKVLLNDASSKEAVFSSFSEGFPFNNPATIKNRPIPNFIDLDNDGDEDILITKQYENFSTEPFDIAWLYENNGGSYDLQQTDFLVDSMLDVGRYAKPVFYDYDNDGDEDLLITNNVSNTETSAIESNLFLYKNTGTQENPVFEAVVNDFLDLSIIPDSNIDLSFGDFDGDGQDDIIAGGVSGKFHFLHNENGVFVSVGNIVYEPPYEDFEHDYGSSSSPVAIDHNADGLSDILFGRSTGTIGLLTNKGLSESGVPMFENTNEYIGNISVQIPGTTGGNSTLTYEVDNDILNLFVASQEGSIYYYKDVDLLSEQLIIPQDTINVNSNYLKPSLNIASSDKKYLITGNGKGGIELLKYEVDSINTINNKVEFLEDFVTIYPNPCYNNLRVQADQSQNYSLKLFNNIGIQEDIVLVKDEDIIEIDMSNKPAGIFYIQLKSKNNRFYTHKFLKLNY